MGSEPDRYKQIVESLEDVAIFTTDVEGIIETWNVGSQQIYGYAAREIVGTSCSILFTPEDRALAHDKSELHIARTTGRAADDRWHLRKGGGRFFASGLVFPLRAPGGEIGGFVKIARDRTGEKQAREMAAQAIHRLETITDAVPALVSYVDLDGRYLFVNQAYEDFFGRTRERILGATISELAGEAAWRVAKPHFERALAGETVVYDLEVPRRGKPRWIRAHYIPDREDGKIHGVTILGMDMTAETTERFALGAARDDLERTVTKRTARLTQLNRELETFTYSASHDLRAPLRKIDAFAAQIQAHCGPVIDAACGERFKRIRESVRGMHRLIDDMLSIAKVTQAELKQEPVDLTALALEIVAALRAGEPERKVEVVVQPGLSVRGDPGLWRAALANLLQNAWKFTGRSAAPRIEFGAKMEGASRVFFVSDNGVGFDEAHAQKLFQAFQRLHRPEDFPGTGVGLAIVERAITRQGGRVWAASPHGQGATFYFEAP